MLEEPEGLAERASEVCAYRVAGCPKWLAASRDTKEMRGQTSLRRSDAVLARGGHVET
jgi:hypothetical protein